MVRESRSVWLPSVTLGGQYNAFASSATSFTAEWQGALRVSYALFTGGQRSSVVARAEAERVAAEQTLRLAQLEVATAVDGALAALAQADAQVQALEAAVVQFEAVVAVERLSLDTGAGVQSEYLDAESQLVESRAALAAARAARVLARVELARAAGELNLDWIIDNVEQAP
jgi:outer membrane protein